MTLPTLSDPAPFKNKRALVRVDWNVPVENGLVTDDFRIQKSLKTLNFLKEAGASVTLITHLEPESLSVEVLKGFVPPGMKILENLRQNPGEEKNEESFAEELASGQDFFVNEAFSVSHRPHASIVGVPKFLPSLVGFQFAKEVERLSQMFKPEKPFLFILGGAKFETKIPLIEKFLPLADWIFVGGALAHNFFKELGVDIGESLVSAGNFPIKEFLESGKIILPSDTVIKDRHIMDAGAETIETLKEKIGEARTILWNGPLGHYENGFKAGTLSLAEALADSGKETVVGGADTLAAIKELNLFAKFSFVSTGGGAMLDFLSSGTLPGIEAIKQSLL